MENKNKLSEHFFRNLKTEKKKQRISSYYRPLQIYLLHISEYLSTRETCPAISSSSQVCKKYD